MPGSRHGQPMGIRKLAATSKQQRPETSGNINNDLSERNTAALAFIRLQLRESDLP